MRHLNRIGGLMATSLLAASLGSAAALADGWTRGDAEGTAQALISGDTGGSITLFCPSGQADKTAGFIINGANFPAAPDQAQTVSIEFNIDGGVEHLDAAFFGDLNFRATTRREFDELSGLVERLRAGNHLQVDVRSLGWSESFVLKGSSVALEGLLKGCEPK